jgi:hypothetical protein
VALVLTREPLNVTLPTPTIIRLTAAPSPLPTSTAALPTATALPTFTPPPTPDRSVVPDEITVGYFAQVANTEGIGVSLRSGASTDNLRLELLPEGTLMLVIGGPEEGSGFIWWQIQLEDETTGWVASDFMIPAAELEGSGDSE